MVRLLVTRNGQVLVEPRADGRGLDIPSLRVGHMAVDECLRALMVRSLGDIRPAVLLGYVRNVVDDAPESYPWPAPHAHFAVWHCEAPADVDGHGEWLDLRAGEAQLGDRHWWPLAAHVQAVDQRR
jgi:hypothetical protein